MASTTNFGWTTPDDTALVKDGAAAIRSLGSAIDTSMMDLKGGTTGQVLSKASNTDMDFTWTSETDPTAIQKTIVDAKGDLISATAADTPARLAVGTEGQVLTVASAEATGLKWTTPSSGLSFTERINVNNGNYFNAIAYNGSNLYVAAGGGGQLYSSTDGKTWTSRTSGFGANQIYDVSFGNGLFVAVGQNGTLTTSTDGTTWTARTSNMATNIIQKAIYANSLWVAVGSGGGTTNTGGIIYSTDGLTWTRKSQSLTVGADYFDVSWNGTNWVVVASNSTNNYLRATTPSGTWTAAASGSGTDLYRIWWDGTRHFIADTSGNLSYTTSTSIGTTTNINVFKPGINQATSAIIGTLYNGIIYSGRSAWLQSVTMATSAYPSFSTPSFSPTATLRTSVPFLDERTGCVWYGAAGWIIGGEGKLWTSF